MKREKTVNYICSICFYLFILFSFSSLSLEADNSAGSKITIDWKEFRSLLKLDVDEIRLSWEEFSRLMEQTGSTYKPEYKVESGEVVLKREEFKKLLDRMKPPTGEELIPPADYVITKATYNGVMGSASTTFIVSLNLEIFDKKKESYLKIPLFQENLAISEVQLDGKPASVITESGWHYLSTSLVGRHSVSVKFSIGSSPDKGSPGLNFNIPQTPITYLSLDIPRPNLEVNIQYAKEVIKKDAKGHTIIRSYLSPASYMNVSWKIEDKRVERGPGRIYSEFFNLLSIEADAISVTTRLELNVVQNKINSLSLIVPENYQVIGVNGEGLGGWSVKEEKERQVLDISFEYPFEGVKVITLKSEKLLPEETIVANFEGFEVLGAMRESGYVAGEVKSDAEAEVQEFNNLERIDFQKIPPELSNLSVRPILFAFKYLRHPFDMVVRITKYEKEEALTSFIDIAKGVTLFREDGKMVHQVTFTMQNLWDQFLKLNLPEDVSIWSVYVNGKREKASKGDDGKVLIPLARSERSPDGALIPFDIELVYTEELDRFGFLGKKKNYFPTTDILINKAEWTLYLPVNYDYIRFLGNLEPVVFRPEPVITVSEMEEEILEDESEARIMDLEKKELSGEGLVDIAGGTPSKAPPEPIDLRSDKIGGQFTTGKAGLLSVRINIPISGVRYSFEKKLVEREEELFLSFTYTNEIIKKTLFLLLIIIVLFSLLKQRKIFLPIFNGISRIFVRSQRLFTIVLRPKEFLIIITFILFLWMWTRAYWYYPLLSFVLILLFIVSIVRFIRSLERSSK
jgi:hypothetical protein